MKMETLGLRLFPLMVGAAVGALGCSSANSNNLTPTTARMPAQKSGATVVLDRNGRPMPYAAAQPVAAQQARAMPGASGQMTEQVTTVGYGAAGGQMVLPSNAPMQNMTQIAPSTGMEQAADPEGAIQAIDRKAIGAEESFHDRRAPRRSFVDITAQPWFSHASDYRWLAGQLHYSKTENCWRLRYASLDESDAYGGEVTLVDYPPLEYLKDGQYVRVNGQLTDPEKKEFDCSFKVASMQPVQNGGATPTSGDASGVKPAGLSQ